MKTNIPGTSRGQSVVLFIAIKAGTPLSFDRYDDRSFYSEKYERFSRHNIGHNYTTIAASLLQIHFCTH